MFVVEKRKDGVGLLSREKVDGVVQSRVHVRKGPFFTFSTHSLEGFQIKERAMQNFGGKVVKVEIFIESNRIVQLKSRRSGDLSRVDQILRTEVMIKRICMLSSTPSEEIDADL